MPADKPIACLGRHQPEATEPVSAQLAAITAAGLRRQQFERKLDNVIALLRTIEKLLSSQR